MNTNVYSGLNLVLTVLLLAYAVVLGWYIRGMIVKRNKPPEEDRPSHHHHRHGRKRLAGRKCPDCGKVIDARRTVCQHCGHKFEMKPGSEPHPDEVKTGIRQPAPDPPEKK